MHFRITIAAVFLVLLPARSFAKAVELGQSPTEVQRLYECAALSDEARLACFDQAVAALRGAEARGSILLVERESVVQARRAAFGFSLPALSTLLGTDSELDQVETTLIRAASSRGSGWTFHLADGSVWQQVDTLRLALGTTSGQPVRVRRAAMGSYMLKVGNNPAVRAQRRAS